LDSDSALFQSWHVGIIIAHLFVTTNVWLGMPACEVPKVHRGMEASLNSQDFAPLQSAPPKVCIEKFCAGRL
jgi:hypothetical protein